MEKFLASICTGTIHDKEQNVSRYGSWIPARDIPLQHLANEYGSPESNGRHPHNVDGLGWCLEECDWRNMKNARVHEQRVEVLTYDPFNSKVFYK